MVLLLVSAVCGFAWLTQHPEAAWLEAAEEWPLVGPLAERFRGAYLGEPAEEGRAVEERDSAPVVVIVGSPTPDEPLDLTGGRRRSDGSRAAPADPRSRSDEGSGARRPAAAAGVPDLTGTAGALDESRISEVTLPRPPKVEIPAFALPPPPSRRRVDREWLLPGTVLRSAPSATAVEIERTRELASVPVLDRRGEWLRVRLRGRDGWADPSTPDTEVGKAGFASFAGRYAARPRTDVVRRVKKMLDLREPNGAIGPFPLYTDVEDQQLLELLDRVAQRLDEAYQARFGLGLPKRRSRPQVALFAKEADFRALARETPNAPVHARGFAPGGMAVFYVGDDPLHLVITGIVHELTHTLNRHALGSSLPPWLEEGMAEDLGGVWIEDPDAPSPALTHPGDGRRHGWRMQEIVGAVAVLRADDVWAPNTALVELDRNSFFGVGQGRHYKQSQLFIRCLLDGDDGRLADGFRGFLSDTAEGYPPRPESLLEHLGQDWPEIERACREHRQELAEEIRGLLPEGLVLAGIS